MYADITSDNGHNTITDFFLYNHRILYVHVRLFTSKVNRKSHTKKRKINIQRREKNYKLQITNLSNFLTIV